jgi:pyruvate formate lyase activating enzyme
MLRIGGITDTSTVDWYGNVSLVVFFAGCNLRCPYCQNSSLIPADSGSEIRIEALRRRIDLSAALLDAAVFTGGEPILQPEGLLEAAHEIKKAGLKLMLNTNGCRPDVVERLIERSLVDRVALDVKAPLTAEDYGAVIGVAGLGAQMAKNVERVLDTSHNLGVEVEARTTVAPTVSDEPEFIRRIASSVRNRCDVYYLQQYDNMGDILSPTLKAMKPPDRESMMCLARIALGEGVKNVYIKTRELGLERVV